MAAQGQDMVGTSTSYRLLRDAGRAFLDISRGRCAPAAERRAFVQTIMQPECSLTRSAKHFLPEDLPTQLSAGIGSFCPEPAA
jgi:hypothetical protein